MNWAAAWHLMQQNELEKPPCSVTAEFSVKFKKPTPMDRPIRLVARIADSSSRRASTTAELKEGHPAFHRW
jgi:acyl-coenzyme A thioesterase PaaI-like protein